MDFRSEGGKLIFRNGDIARANKEQADRQHVERILYNPKGAFLLNPTLGVGIKNLLNGPFDPGDVRKDIRVNLKADNFKVHNIEIEGTEDDEPTLTVNATR